MTDTPVPAPEKPEREFNAAPLLALAVLAAAIVAFILQNSDSYPVKWLMFDGKAPTWLVIVVSAVAGAILERLAVWTIKRRRRSVQRV
jgi:uncharacterized integral membrane protein